MNNSITTIAFDADDIWINESYFQEAEKEFCILPEDYNRRNARDVNP
jgi:putative hydrolase of the HAD superfamily